MAKGWTPDRLVQCPCCGNEYETDDYVPFSPSDHDLYCAADGLLAACKDGLAALEMARENVVNMGGMRSEEAKSFAAPLRRMRAAIRKAEGRRP